MQVPYPGSPQITTDLIGGRIMMSFQITSAIIGQIKAGQIKALAVATEKRSDLIPDVPTMAEAGMPDFNTPLWFGLLAPAGTPRPVIDKLAAAAKQAMHAPDTVDVAAKGRLRAGRHGAGSVRRFHQKRNHALVRRCERRRYKGMKPCFG